MPPDMAEFTYNGKEFIDYLKDLDAVRQFIVAQDIELAARAARADKLEAELKYIFDLLGRYLGSDLVPLPKERDVDHEDLWLSLDEAGFGRIVVSPEFMRLRIIEALGDAAPSSDEGEDEVSL